MKQQYIILIVCLLIALVAIWREIQRENKSRLLWRIIAVVVAVITLACIILPISYQGSVDLSDTNSAVLLTDGFDKDSLGNYSNAKIYTLSHAVKKAYPKATLISSTDELTHLKSAISKLHVFGYGLAPYQLKQLNNLPISFHPTKQAGGINSVSWNARLKIGEQLHVQGTYVNTGQQVKLVLKGLGTTLDSTFINGNATAAFNLQATPKHNGRAIFRLLSIRDADTLENESLPIELTPVKPLKVLILASAPDFENNFLKNWLTTNGYGVAVRNMISKDKFSQDFVNVDQQSLQHLTATIFEKFDVVLSDLDVLKTMNSAESAALRQAVEQKGLGVIVRADSTAHSGFWLQRSFPSVKASSQGQVIASLKVQDKANIKLLIDPVYITYQNYTQPLITDAQNHILASTGLAGSGRVVYTTLYNTHNLMLGGDEKDYTALWSLLINKAAKHSITTEQWTVQTAVPTVGSKTGLQLETSVADPAVKLNQTAVAAEGNPALPYATALSYWPQHAGWQQAQQANGAAKWWFVYPANEWTALKQNKLLYDTRTYAAAFNNQLTVTKQIHQKVQIAVPKIYFYLLLLASFIFLWIEAKFLS